MTWQAYATTSNATIRTCNAFKVFSLYASLFWWVTNQRDSRLLLLMVSFGLAKGLVFHLVFGSFSDMAGFLLMDCWGFVYYEWSGIDLAIPQTTKTWVDDK